MNQAKTSIIQREALCCNCTRSSLSGIRIFCAGWWHSRFYGSPGCASASRRQRLSKKETLMILERLWLRDSLLFAQLRLVDAVSGVVKSTFTMTDNLFHTYDALQHKNLVDSREMELLSAWLLDME